MRKIDLITSPGYTTAAERFSTAASQQEVLIVGLAMWRFTLFINNILASGCHTLWGGSKTLIVPLVVFMYSATLFLHIPIGLG